MTATISQISGGLKTRLQTIAGLRVFDYQPDNLMPPVAFPEINGVNFKKSMQGGIEVDASAIIIVGSVSDRSSQDLLDQYLSYSGARSLRAAIEGDRTLGGVVQTLSVHNGFSIEQIKMADARYLSIQVKIMIIG